MLPRELLLCWGIRHDSGSACSKLGILRVERYQASIQVAAPPDSQILPLHSCCAGNVAVVMLLYWGIGQPSLLNDPEEPQLYDRRVEVVGAVPT